jgi:hypothetical protein
LSKIFSADEFRVRFPQYERQHAWFSMLLDCLALVDASVAEAVSAFAGQPACKLGCDICCYQYIPVTPLELAGLKLYIEKEIPPALLRILAEKNVNAETSPNSQAACRFLFRKSCAVYPVRPIACRRYVVFNKCCVLGENPVDTRPADVLKPSRTLLNQALGLTLPYYAALGESTPEPGQAFAFCAKRTIALASFSHKILERFAGSSR